MDKDYSSDYRQRGRVGDIVVGLDIGTTKVATIVGYLNERGKIEVLGFGKSESKGVEYGLIQNILKTSDSITKSVQLAIQHSHYDQIEGVYAGIAARHIKSKECKHYVLRPNHNSLIEQEELDSMRSEVENIALPPGQKIITTIPQKYIIEDSAFGTSHESSDPVGEIGSKVTGCYQILTGNVQEIQKIEQCISRVGLSIEDLILEPIASGLACLSDDDKRRGVVLVDIGGGTTDMVIFKDGHPVFSKVIPLGGSIITKDIAQVCHIPEDTAEELKKNHGSCIPSKSNPNRVCNVLRPNGQQPLKITEEQLAKIIYSRVHRDILGYVKKALEDSGYMPVVQNGAGLVLTGGGANLRHIVELCQYDIGLATRVGYPTVGFSDSLSNELKHPLFSTALGLLKYGLESQNIEKDFNATGSNVDDSEGESNKKRGREPEDGKETLWKKLSKTFVNIFEQIS